jgi:hypothetical protein
LKEVSVPSTDQYSLISNSSVALTHEFPVGRYEVVLGDDLEAAVIEFDATEMYFNGKVVSGLVHCRIIAPRNTFYPILLTTIGGSQTVATLCYECSRKQCIDDCNHSDLERSWIDCYTTAELVYALQNGYAILQYFEVLIYSQRKAILQRYMALLGYYKLKHSEIPSDIKGRPEAMSAYCDRLNAEMNFKELIQMQLTPDILDDNPEMRFFYKDALCKVRTLQIGSSGREPILHIHATFSLQTLGFFSLNSEKQVTVKFITQYDELYSYASRERISEITAISDKYMQLTLKSEAELPQQTSSWKVSQSRYPSRKSNCVIGAFITSISRCVIHAEIMRIHAVGGTVLKVACDSLFYVLPPDSVAKDPLPISQSFGKWKHVYPGKFLALAQMGVNSYASLHLAQDGQIVSQAKASGMVMSKFLTEDINFQLYSDMTDKLISDHLFDFTDKKFHNLRKKGDKKSLTFNIIRKRRSVFSRNLFLKRKLDLTLHNRNRYILNPYGFRG